MSDIRRFRRRRLAGLPAAAGASLLAAAAGAAAQTDNPIEHCRTAAASDQARIACLEAALAQALGLEAAAAPDDAPTVLGAEQVLARNREPGGGQDAEKETIEARLEDFAVNRNGDIVFFLDNGQIWRQKQADSNALRLSRKKAYSVSVSKGVLSGYRLEIRALKRSVLVERLK
ncbi:hypothetical protein [Amphiplicatus metriothermophilus]|uniref:Uncharacterized protein n=1 Tax=Amphiplicatus metriothermophilus TaxID=1519374 RepID=A0A239PSN9_9PROT|nr:hypothetical protein [Amphiplicatus metriothermophilus]MBB5519230.1 hypothetical protein [Amphiplicatus metriothermophilus]SNT73299.1 hypothetical protein SAMN06297382_1697 [Amphiplicatus metriothermophilus]